MGIENDLRDSENSLAEKALVPSPCPVIFLLVCPHGFFKKPGAWIVIVIQPKSSPTFYFLFYYYYYFVVLGLELRAFTLSHSTSPIFGKGFLR
jgi:hypothetical protein